MALLDLLIPAACSGCGRYGEALCSACRSNFRPAGSPRDRFATPDPGIVIGDELEVGVAAFAYEGTLRRVLSRLKYGGAARLARPLADAAAPLLAGLAPVPAGAALVPVPVHPERRRRRGYNQAVLLARELSRTLQLPVVDILVRRRPTTQQHRLNRTERLRNLRAAFAAGDEARSPPAVVLVDDILTTSATLEACAGVLRRAGAERIIGVTIAREI